MRRPRLLPIVLASILAAVGLYLAWRGQSFYQLGLEERVDHPEFQLLRPSGLLGNALGYGGALLVFLNLLYLARRRHLFTFGSMRAWLDAHVFTGLLAYELAIFHSAFQLRTSVAKLTAASMAIVVGTGIIGRFLYALAGRAVERQLPSVADELDERVAGLGTLVLAAADAYPPTQLPADASHVRCVLTVPRWRREASARRQAVRLVARNHPAVAAAGDAELDALIARAGQAAAAEVRSISRAALLRSWRSLHRFFAILMLLAVLVHGAVAWHFGYRWIFG